MRDRKPYDPARDGPQACRGEAQRSRIHDRRARDVNRGSVAHIVETEVDDPYEPGAKIATVRSIRDDPLADHYYRHHIDHAQYLAGREFQRQFGLAERGPRAVQLSEAVDGSPLRESLTEAQLRAGKWLTTCYVNLGQDGSILVSEMLIQNRTTRQMAAARGLAGSDWERYFSRRVFECLNTLSLVFGFSNGTST